MPRYLPNFLKLISETCVFCYDSQDFEARDQADTLGPLYCTKFLPFLLSCSYRMEQLCVCFNVYCSLMHTNNVTKTEVEGAQDQTHLLNSNLKFCNCFVKARQGI